MAPTVPAAYIAERKRLALERAHVNYRKLPKTSENRFYTIYYSWGLGLGFGFGLALVFGSLVFGKFSVLLFGRFR